MFACLPSDHIYASTDTYLMAAHKFMEQGDKMLARVCHKIALRYLKKACYPSHLPTPLTFQNQEEAIKAVIEMNIAIRTSTVDGMKPLIEAAIHLCRASITYPPSM